MLLYDSGGNRIGVNLENPFASGAEGTICHINGNGEKVAKIYKQDTVNQLVKEKIYAMVKIYRNMIAEDKQIISSQITWPEELLFDDKGNFKGFIMRFVDSHETLDMAYALGDHFTYKQRVGIAKNLCIVVNVMHSKLKKIVGDFNPRNIMVSTQKGTVYLVDSDSFHLQVKQSLSDGRQVTRFFPAVVGRPEYEPKELVEYLQKNRYDLGNCGGLSFTRESDLFALAIHIFCLLMDGTHPYAVGINVGEKHNSIASVNTGLNTNILKERYIYSKNPRIQKNLAGMKTPDYAPDFNRRVPLNMQKLFEQAFVPSDPDLQGLRYDSATQYFSEKTIRPTAGAWYFELHKLYDRL